MYLRTTKRRNADGTEVRYHQLAENEWDPQRGCAVAKVIYNFGRADQVDSDMLRRLARSILRVLGEDVVDGRVEARVEGATGPVRVRDAWPYGGVHVVEQLWTELGIPEVLAGCARKAGSRQPFERALFAMVANRTLEPYSKLYCWEQWLRDEVYLPSAHELELHHLYRAMDFLEEYKGEVEKAVYFKMADLMNADVDLIFYDTTSLHFEVDQEDELDARMQERTYRPLRKRGYSKNGRGDAPQIVVGLAVTRDGLPVRSWVFPGNTSDVTTVGTVKKDLQGWRLGRCVFVGDAGMNSEENRRRLALGNGKYILASKMRGGDEVTVDVLARAGRYKPVQGNLRVKEVFVGDGERRRRYVVCHNPEEATRQREHRKKLLEELDTEISSMRETDGRHSKRTCELISSARFGRYLRETSGGALRIDRKAVKEAMRYDGKWVITTNDDTLTAEDLALSYKQLMRVERCWRQLKSGLRMRPVFHWRPWRIQAHVTISVLALLLERIAEVRAGDTWRNIVARLGAIKVIEYEHGQARIRQTTELRPGTEALLRRLGVAAPPKVHSVERAEAQDDAPTLSAEAEPGANGAPSV
jgi:hypothetical protein